MMPKETFEIVYINKNKILANDEIMNELSNNETKVLNEFDDNSQLAIPVVVEYEVGNIEIIHTIIYAVVRDHDVDMESMFNASYAAKRLLEININSTDDNQKHSYSLVDISTTEVDNMKDYITDDILSELINSIFHELKEKYKMPRRLLAMFERGILNAN